MDVYLDEFILLIQVGGDERTQMLKHLFHMTNRVFFLNVRSETNRKYPISLKKLMKGGAAWSTRKNILVWDLDMEVQLLCLPEDSSTRMCNVLANIPSSTHRCSLRNWCRLLGLIRSITPEVSGSQGMFTRLQHALTSEKGRYVQLTSDVHDKLHIWGRLLAILESRPTHLREITHFSPSWFGATYASEMGMSDVCQDNNGKMFV